MKKTSKLLIIIALCLLLLTGCCLSHEWTEADCLTPKTCTKCGEIDGEALGHSFADATCTAPKTCTVCGLSEGETLGHSFADATCTAPKTCAVCGLTEGETLSHSYDDWTENADGSAESVCSGCGDTKTMSAEDWAVNQFIVGEWHGFASGLSTSYFRDLAETTAEEFSITFHADGTFEQFCTLYKEENQQGTWSYSPIEGGIGPASYRFVLELESGTVTVFNAAFYKTAFGIKTVDESHIALALDVSPELSIVVFHEKM